MLTWLHWGDRGFALHGSGDFERDWAEGPRGSWLRRWSSLQAIHASPSGLTITCVGESARTFSLPKQIPTVAVEAHLLAWFDVCARRAPKARRVWSLFGSPDLGARTSLSARLASDRTPPTRVHLTPEVVDVRGEHVPYVSITALSPDVDWPRIWLEWRGKRDEARVSMLGGPTAIEAAEAVAITEVVGARRPAVVRRMGWLAREEVRWTRVPALPEPAAKAPGYRDSARDEVELLVRRGRSFDRLVQRLAITRLAPSDATSTARVVAVEARLGEYELHVSDGRGRAWSLPWRTLWKIDEGGKYRFGRYAELHLAHDADCPVEAALKAHVASGEPRAP
ncbi:MAG: hypothetical protein H6721_19865 [Sandaracinus sp.]|nr:hypothetical protein [Sandaracinus sp.]MCB9619676.1 hypothetical protein [Sandaracinus sp.]MCB9634387.1 hypothetical protein [Sandaracinus sp.]